MSNKCGISLGLGDKTHTETTPLTGSPSVPAGETGVIATDAGVIAETDAKDMTILREAMEHFVDAYATSELQDKLEQYFALALPSVSVPSSDGGAGRFTAAYKYIAGEFNRGNVEPLRQFMKSFGDDVRSGRFGAVTPMRAHTGKKLSLPSVVHVAPVFTEDGGVQQVPRNLEMVSRDYLRSLEQAEALLDAPGMRKMLIMFNEDGEPTLVYPPENMRDSELRRNGYYKYETIQEELTKTKADINRKEAENVGGRLLWLMPAPSERAEWERSVSKDAYRRLRNAYSYTNWWKDNIKPNVQNLNQTYGSLGESVRSLFGVPTSIFTGISKNVGGLTDTTSNWIKGLGSGNWSLARHATKHHIGAYDDHVQAIQAANVLVAVPRDGWDEESFGLPEAFVAMLQGELMGYMRRHGIVVTSVDGFVSSFSKTTCKSVWTVFDSFKEKPQPIDACEMYIVSVERPVPNLMNHGISYGEGAIRAHRMMIKDPSRGVWAVNALPLSAEGEFSAHLLVDDIGHVRGVMHTKTTEAGNEQTLYLN
jgi:hypothetical protein